MKKNNKIPVIINCDTGIDDAVAIILAVKSKKLDIKLITTDVGIVSAKQSAKNTLNILELIKAPEIPVLVGNDKCFSKERERFIDNENNGLGGYELKNNNRKITQGDAVEGMYNVLMSSNEKVSIVCISSPTNIANLLKNHNDCKEKIEKLVFMAGSIKEIKDGEIPIKEFNVSSDPEAFEYILNSGINIVIVPIEMGYKAYLDWEDVYKTKNINSTGETLEYIYRSYKDKKINNGIAINDGCAIAYLTNPELFEEKDVFAKVEYYDNMDTGVLIMDFNKKSNIKTCTEINISKFKKLYFCALKHCK